MWQYSYNIYKSQYFLCNYYYYTYNSLFFFFHASRKNQRPTKTLTMWDHPNKRLFGRNFGTKTWIMWSIWYCSDDIIGLLYIFRDKCYPTTFFWFFITIYNNIAFLITTKTDQIPPEKKKSFFFVFPLIYARNLVVDNWLGWCIYNNYLSIITIDHLCTYAKTKSLYHRLDSLFFYRHLGNYNSCLDHKFFFNYY